MRTYTIDYFILRGRKQRTELRNVTLNLEDVNGGILQGSKTGPLAFIVKINTLEQALETLENNSNMIVIFMVIPDHTTL